jgi:hypothetical protein
MEGGIGGTGTGLPPMATKVVLRAAEEFAVRVWRRDSPASTTKTANANSTNVFFTGLTSGLELGLTEA